MREREVEAHWKEQFEAIGGISRKHVSPGKRGAQDQVCAILGLPAFFVEVKRPGEEPTGQQRIEHADWLAKGVVTHVVDSYESVDALILDILQRLAA